MLILTSLSALQASSSATSLSTVSQVAEIVIAVALLVLAVLGAVLFFRVNSIIREVQRAAHQSLGPVSDRARAISDNVEFITQALRSDVEQLHASVGALTDRLHLASERMEERIEEFNALMEVVQGEAEELFLDTASTMRGVREGARTIAAGSIAGRSPARREGDESREGPPGQDSAVDAGAMAERDVGAAELEEDLQEDLQVASGDSES